MNLTNDKKAQIREHTWHIHLSTMYKFTVLIVAVQAHLADENETGLFWILAALKLLKEFVLFLLT